VGTETGNRWKDYLIYKFASKKQGFNWGTIKVLPKNDRLKFCKVPLDKTCNVQFLCHYLSNVTATCKLKVLGRKQCFKSFT
jgi:hypothetical protein